MCKTPCARFRDFAMASNNVTISTSLCLYEIKGIIDDVLRPKTKKLASFENVCEVLQNCGILVTERPDEKVRNMQFMLSSYLHRRTQNFAKSPPYF